MSNEQEEARDLITYTAMPLDLTRHVIEAEIPLRELTPENRIIMEKGFLGGRLKNLSLKSYGIRGDAEINFYEEINKTKKTILDIGRKIFGKNSGQVIEKDHFEKEGKIYGKIWGMLESGNLLRIYSDRWEAEEGFIENLKREIFSSQNQLFSREFIINLYNPLFQGLVELYRKIEEF